jgi:hypothetical protein
VGAGRETQKGQPRSAKTKPSRAEDSLRDPTQAPGPLPGATSKASAKLPRWSRCAKEAALATTESKGETKEEGKQDKMPAREPIRMRRAKAWLASVSAALPCTTAPVGAGARRHRDGVEAAVAQTFRRYRARERRRGSPRAPRAVTRRAQERRGRERLSVPMRGVAQRRGVRPGRIWG